MKLRDKLFGEHGGADIVLDCFADIYATSVLPLLRPGGKYITCGIFAQAGVEARSAVSSARWRDLLAFVIMNNIPIHGNCLGSDSDLRNAIAEYANINSRIQIDCLLGPEDSLQFVERTFVCPDRFGKVILQYDSSKV